MRQFKKTLIASLAASFIAAMPAFAEAPKVVAVEASSTGMGWTFAVTLSHPDTGWDHFADGWEVVDEAGNVLGHRKLQHPHVEEQPFKRSLKNVLLPDGTRKVYIRVRCNAHGWKEETHEVLLKR
jgi:hypothetical protein